MTPSIENQIAGANNTVDELQEAMDIAITALNALDEAIDDADSINSLELRWADGVPEPYVLIRKLKLISAEFTHTEELL